MHYVKCNLSTLTSSPQKLQKIPNRRKKVLLSVRNTQTLKKNKTKETFLYYENQKMSFTTFCTDTPCLLNRAYTYTPVLNRAYTYTPFTKQGVHVYALFTKQGVHVYALFTKQGVYVRPIRPVRLIRPV